MAGCGEVDHTVDVLTSSKVMDDGGDTCVADSSSSAPVPECAICLQSCIHPVRLPCHHVFCFLCVKGASWHSKRCALCRREVPEDFLERPTLLSPEELKAAATGVSGGGGAGSGTRGGHAWYYEGRNGWWQYDERTSRELEEASAKGRKSTEMLIAGFLYVADLENMVQYRRNEHGRRRKMKRDAVGIPKKGVAGLRLDPEPVPSAAVATEATGRTSSADGADTVGQSPSAGSPQGVLVPLPPVRPPTVLGGHLVSPPSPSPTATLEDSLSQLLIGQPEGEDPGGDEEAGPSSAGQAYESASGSSEGEEEEDDGERRGGSERERGDAGPRQRHRHRLLHRRLRETQPDRLPPGGGSSSSPLSMRSRSPDGQCTVSEV